MRDESRDGGARPPIHLVSTGFSKQGCGHCLWPLISARGPVPPGFLWNQQGGGVNQDSWTMKETECAQLGPPNSASGGPHHAEVRTTRNGSVKPP